MNSRVFIVSFQGNENTRWLASEEELGRTLQMLANTAAKCWSDGSLPKVKVATGKSLREAINQEEIKPT